MKLGSTLVSEVEQFRSAVFWQSGWKLRHRPSAGRVC